MFIYSEDFAEASYLYKKNDNQNKNSQGKQTHSWMDLLAIIELRRWGSLGLPRFSTLKHWETVVLELQNSRSIHKYRLQLK